jgi:hypothetical protein
MERTHNHPLHPARRIVKPPLRAAGPRVDRTHDRVRLHPRVRHHVQPPPRPSMEQEAPMNVHVQRRRGAVPEDLSKSGVTSCGGRPGS